MVIDSLKSEYRFYDGMSTASLGYGQGSATTMTYSASGRLCCKLQPSTLQNLVYGYSQTDMQHAPRRILNNKENVLNDLLWETTGCLGVVSSYDDHMNFNTQRQLHWTEDCRLSDVADMEFFSHYGYDSEGTRWLKMTGASSMQVINGDMATCMANLNNVTLYASPYLVATNTGYTKHYYAGTERVAARVGNGGLVYSTPFIAIDTALRGNADRLFARCMASMSKRHIQPNNPAVVSGLCNNNVPAFNLPLRQSPSALSATVSPVTTAFASAMESCAHQSQVPEAAYYYHGDHLGGATWITDGTGLPVQHLQYHPFGEPYVNQRATGSTYNERYTFTGKERDEETGYSYFGARYYDSGLPNIFLSVDPMSDKYPSISPYAYCAWNPVRLVDPNGCDTTVSIDLMTGRSGFHSDNTRFGNQIVEFTYDSKPIDSYKCAGNVSVSRDNNDISVVDFSNLSDANNVYDFLMGKNDYSIDSDVEWNCYDRINGDGKLVTSHKMDEIRVNVNGIARGEVSKWRHYHPGGRGLSLLPSEEDLRHCNDLGVPSFLSFCGKEYRFDKIVKEFGTHIPEGKLKQLVERYNDILLYCK